MADSEHPDILEHIHTNRRKMQYERSISLGNILTMLLMSGGLITVYAQFKSDIAVMQVSIIQQQRDIEAQRIATQTLRNDIRDDIREIKADQRRISDAIEGRGLMAGRSAR